MRLTKEPPYSLGELACLINATIEVLKIDVTKLSNVSMSEMNRTLIEIGYGYNSSFSLREQWCQYIDVLDRMEISQEEKNQILEDAYHKYDYLSSHKRLI